MGIEALYRRPRTSTPHPGHKVFPYLQRNRQITAPSQTWAMDIPYIRMRSGFVYFVAVMDRATRRCASVLVLTTYATSLTRSALFINVLILHTEFQIDTAWNNQDVGSSERWGGPLLQAVAAALTVFPGCASANPMKVQNVFFIALGTYALDFRLVAVGVHLEIVVVVLFCLLMLHRRVSFIR